MTNKLYLNAIFAAKRDMHLEISSGENLDEKLKEWLTKVPAAITFSARGVLSTERLVDAYQEKGALLQGIKSSRALRGSRWRYYLKRRGASQFERGELMKNVTELRERLSILAESASEPTICAIMPERHEEETARELLNIITRALVSNEVGFDALTSTKYRNELARERKSMIDQVGTYTSEELAAAVGSTTTNASQFAADQRNAGKLFGVRFGLKWLYPNFQFDAQRLPFPEMKSVLGALSPDEQGWDRLQWFLERHEVLDGHTPLEIWRTDRQKVLQAANTERWNGRD